MGWLPDADGHFEVMPLVLILPEKSGLAMIFWAADRGKPISIERGKDDPRARLAQVAMADPPEIA